MNNKKEMKSSSTVIKFMERNLTPISLYVGIITCCVILIPLLWSGETLVLQLGGMTLSTTIFLGFLNYQHAQDRLFKDLFKEFNERYDKFNDHYQRIADDYSDNVNIEDINTKDKKLIVDYLNLCTEEHFWFEKGRIEQNAWKSWEAGMETWASLPVVRRVFDYEVATWTSSYYTGFQEFFKALIEKAKVDI
ncbi:MAG: hypothetical protein EOO44_00050 [Flavobacterium sp.]|nr:MAG: hypothetical protein EOO44_00050 [Flavobacterium sp.]